MEEPVTSQPGPIDAYDYGYEAPKQMPGGEKSGHISGSLSPIHIITDGVMPYSFDLRFASFFGECHKFDHNTELAEMSGA